MPSMDTSVRSAFLEAARRTVDVIGGRELGERWERPSTLQHLSVGELAAHTGRAILTVHWYLDMPEPEEPPISAGAYYAEQSSDIDAEANVRIRSRAGEDAKGGWARLYLDTGRALEHLEGRLRNESPEHRIPASGRCLLLDEYLRTRIVELVVHLDDLCPSLDVGVPDLPAAEKIAIDVLIETAVIRHGRKGVLHALARQERAPENALRIL